MNRYNLIPVRDEQALHEAGIPYRSSTLRHFKYTKKFPQIFVNIGRSLYIDLAEWEKVIEAAIEDRNARIQNTYIDHDRLIPPHEHETSVICDPIPAE